jgi:hypothetical protein
MKEESQPLNHGVQSNSHGYCAGTVYDRQFKVLSWVDLHINFHKTSNSTEQTSSCETVTQLVTKSPTITDNKFHLSVYKFHRINQSKY